MSAPRESSFHRGVACSLLCALSLTLGCSSSEAMSWSAAYDQLIRELSEQRPTSQAPPALSLKLGPELSAEVYSLPRLRDRATPSPPSPKIAARAMLSISRCEVSRWVAHRNSPLGRVMLPSQRLLYEASFLSTAPDCQPSEEVARALSDALTIKRAQWRTRLYELTWRGRALSRFFSVNWRRDRRPAPPSAAQLAALSWLGGLSTWAESLAPLPSAARKARRAELQRQLEPALQSLSPHSGGRVLKEGHEAYLSLRAWLRGLSAAPLSALPCEKVHLLLAAYQRLQPELSARVRRLDQLTEATAALTNLTEPTPMMSPLLTQGLGRGEGGLSQQLKSLSKAHAQVLSPLLERCELKPAPQGSGSSSDVEPSAP